MFLRSTGVQALALYLLLVTVADSQGLSYYSDKTAARLLGLNEVELRQARHNLVNAGLIAHQAPLYQVLSLEPTFSSETSAPRYGQTLPISARVVSFAAFDSAAIRERVIRARCVQLKRFCEQVRITCNARMTPRLLPKYCALGSAGACAPTSWCPQFNLNPRSLRIFRVVQGTISELG